ncbi:hypothetical protein [Caldiplasma sukawensis]
MIIYTNLTSTTGQPSAQNIYVLVVFVAIFSLLILRRLSRYVKGTVLRPSGVIMRTFIYGLITAVSFFLPSLGGIYIVMEISLLIIGTLIGFLLGDATQVYMSDNRMMYKRSIIITALWLISYVTRLIIELEFPFNLLFSTVFNIVLAFTFGLILGEAFQIFRKRREILNEKSQQNMSL